MRTKLSVWLASSIAALAIPATGTPEGVEPTPELRRVCRKVMDLPVYQAARLGIHLAQTQRQQVTALHWMQGTVRAGVGPSPDIRCDDLNCTITSPTEPTLNIAGFMGLLQVDLVQPLYTFGKLSRAGDAADLAIDRAKAEAAQTKAQLLLLVARAYYGHRFAQEVVWMLADGNETVTKALTRIVASIESNSDDFTLTDRYRLQTLLGEIKVRLAEATEKLESTAAMMRVVAGDGFELEGDELLPLAIHGKRVSKTSPELLAARAGAAALAALADIERARFWPDISLFASAQVSSAQGVDNPPSAFANDPFNRQSAAVGVGFEWKLDPVGQSARSKTARTRAHQADALSAAVAQKVDLEAQDSEIKRKATQQRLQAARLGETGARAWLAATLQNEAVGTIEPKELVDAYIAYFTAKGRLLEATFDWNLAVLDYYRHQGVLETVLLPP